MTTAANPTVCIESLYVPNQRLPFQGVDIPRGRLATQGDIN